MYLPSRAPGYSYWEGFLSDVEARFRCKKGCAVARFVRACAFVNIVSTFIMSIPFNVFQVWSKSCFALRSFCCYKFLALFLFVSSRQTVIHVALNFFLRIIFLSPTMATMLVMQILDVSVRIECTVQFFLYMPFSVMKICWQLLADHPSSCGWLPQCPSFLLMDFCSFHPCHFVWPGFLCPSCIILHFEMLNSGTCPFVQLYFFLLTKNRFHYLLFVNKNCLY